MPLTDLESRVCRTIAGRREALLADLRLHVETPTGCAHGPGLRRTRELLTARAAARGAAVETVEGDPRPAWLYPPLDAGVSPEPESRIIAICRREDGHRGAPVLIAGHLDTVHDPGSEFRGLTVAPDGRRATGPGCVDMKGGLVIALAALECLEECGVHLPWTLLLNSDEETGSYHSQRAIYHEAARVCDRGGIGVALEPAGGGERGELIVERAGSGQFFIEVRGRAAHVGRDFASGVSAVTVLARLITRISGLSDPARDLILNIGPIQGGHATNVVPDRARAWGNVRFPSAEAAAELTEQLRTIAAGEVAPPPRAVAVEVATSFVRAAKPLTDGTRRLADLARAVSEELPDSRPLPFGRTAGVCDGNIMQSAGLPTLDTMGVRGGGLHTTSEWIHVPSLVDRCQLLAVFLMRAARAA